MLRLFFAILVVFTGSGLAAPKFEVASIRRCVPDGRGMVPSPPTPGRITLSCISAVSLIRQSYVIFAEGRMNLTPVKIVPMDKGPAWIESDLYTIEAKAESRPGEAPPGQGIMLGPMMQALLEERFGVKVHREIRQTSVYELTVLKDGPRLQAAAEGGCLVQDLDQPITPLARGQVLRPFCGFAMILKSAFDLKGATMAQLATALSGPVGRKVIDNTGIACMFDIRLDWSNDDMPAGPVTDPGKVTADIQCALRRFGLELEPAQGPVEFLVIDRVEKPSENQEYACADSRVSDVVGRARRAFV